MFTDFYVYVLYRLDGTPCYVGKGRGDRWLSHERRKSFRNARLRDIVMEWRAAERPVEKIKIFENLKEADAFYFEEYLIRRLGRQFVGGPLVNMTDGGEGESGKIYTPETIAKMRAAAKGRVMPQEQRDKISAALKGRPKTPEHAAKVGLANLGKKRPFKNRPPLSAEHKAKVSAKLTGSRQRPRGPLSEEHKAKVSAGVIRYNQNRQMRASA